MENQSWRSLPTIRPNSARWLGEDEGYVLQDSHGNKYFGPTPGKCMDAFLEALHIMQSHQQKTRD
jgi:hypothetical protein